MTEALEERAREYARNARDSVGLPHKRRFRKQLERAWLQGYRVQETPTDQDIETPHSLARADGGAARRESA